MTDHDDWMGAVTGPLEHDGQRPKDVYEAFIQEVDHVVVAAGDSAAKVVGDLTRAVKRAQMVIDGELRPVRERLGLS